MSETKPKNPSTLMVTYSDSAEPVSWGSQSSVFSKARELGVNSAIVGWYHPYCRIIGDQVASCMSCNTGRSSLLILALLSGNISDPASVVGWLGTHRSIGRSPYKYKRPH